jgi:hypothetical protein
MHTGAWASGGGVGKVLPGGGVGDLSTKKPRCAGKQNLGAADKGGERQVDGIAGGRAGGTEVEEEAGAKPCLSEDEVFFCLSLSVCHTVSIRANLQKRATTLNSCFAASIPCACLLAVYYVLFRRYAHVYVCVCVCVCVLICIDICACMYTGLGSTTRSKIPSGAEPGSGRWD